MSTAVDIDPAGQAHVALTEALRLAEHGYALTPVTLTRMPNGKKGSKFHRPWRHEAAWSRDPEIIRAWWVDYPTTSFAIGGAANNIEGPDLDVKGGADGVAWWSGRGLPISSFTQITPTGGRHMIWRCRADGQGLPQEAGKTFGRKSGIDTRNRAGLFYAAGAYVLGERGHYEVLGTLPRLDQLDETPDAVIALFVDAAEAERAERVTDGSIVVHDEMWQYRKTEEALATIRAHNPETDGGYRAKLQRAGLFLGRAVEQGFTTAEAAERKWREAHMSVWGPAVWPENVKDFRDALRDGPRLERWRVGNVHAITSAPSAPSGLGLQRASVTDYTSDMPAAQPSDESPGTELAVPPAYDPVAVHEAHIAELVAYELERRQVRRLADEAERPRLLRPFAEYGVWDEDLDSVPAPEMMVGQLIPDRGVGFLGGASGSYKSFVAVALATGVAYGRTVMDHRDFRVNRARKVLYVAAEGSEGVALRCRAARARGGITAARQLMVYRRAVDLTSEYDFAQLHAFMLEHQFEYLIVDTFRQTTLGVNENDNTDVGLILSRLIKVRDDHGIGSMLIDHTNKTAQGLADLGGAGAKRANADYVLMIDLPNGERGRDQQRTLRSAKLKDKIDGRTWPIRLDQVDEVVDADGDASAVARIGEVASVDNEIAWIAAGLGWATHAWRLPGDVENIQSTDKVVATGAVRQAARDLARYMRANADNGVGVSRAEAIDAMRLHSGSGGLGIYGKDNTTARRGWALLVDGGRLQAISGDLTGKSTWVKRDEDPTPPARVYDAEIVVEQDR